MSHKPMYCSICGKRNDSGSLCNCFKGCTDNPFNTPKIVANPTEFQVPVTLEDKDYCNGCDCVAFDRMEDPYCRHFKDMGLANEHESNGDLVVVGDDILDGPYKIIRPDQCKERFDK